MFVRYRHPYIYTVLQSVRTRQGPRHQRVAHWYGTPSLPKAIDGLKHRMKLGDALMAQHRSADLPCNVASRAKELRKLAELEAARAVLGDWVDPVDRPGAERLVRMIWHECRQEAKRRKQAEENAKKEAEMEALYLAAM